MGTTVLPSPRLEQDLLGAIPVLTDNALARTLGVRVAFTGREGGVSDGCYGALNLGNHVNDDPAAVAENVARTARALGADPTEVLVANQVHGTRIVAVRDSGPAALQTARAEAAAGADGFLVTVPGALALLCFADCTPVILVSPFGSFAVAHAGWRGCVGGIASAAARALAEADQVSPAALNVYIGPHIGPCCFEVGDEVAVRFRDAFGPACVEGDGHHVSMAAAIAADLASAGIDGRRIASAGVCTQCHPDRYFSYRASGGVCGRHGALAYRSER